MDLIVLIGPPSVGKYTIAREIEKKLGFSILHNHDVIDLASSALDKTKDSFWEFCWKLRIDIVEEGVREGLLGMVMTLAFTGNDNELKGLKRIFDSVKGSGGKSFVVELVCDLSELNKRVVSKSRRDFGKIQDVRDLEKWLKEYDSKKSFPDKDAFVLDVTRFSPAESANKIIYEIRKK